MPEPLLACIRGANVGPFYTPLTLATAACFSVIIGSYSRASRWLRGKTRGGWLASIMP